MTTLRQVYSYDTAKTREVPVAAGTPAGTPVVINHQPAVTITNEPSTTKVVTGMQGDVIAMTLRAGGFNNAPLHATAAFDGTWAGPVAGAQANTAQGTDVYLAADGSLTLTAATNKFFGVTDFVRDYPFDANDVPVKIGVPLS